MLLKERRSARTPCFALQEADVLQQCDGLLRKLGMRGSIFGTAVNGQASNNSPGTLDTSSSSSSGGGDVVNSQGGGEGSQS